MSASTDTVTAELVIAPIHNELTISHGWRAPRPPSLLYREEGILVVFHHLEIDPYAEVVRAERPELCVLVSKIDFPREFYEAARAVLEGLDKLKEAVPFFRDAL